MPKEVVLKYTGGGAGLTMHNVPGRDLTSEDLERLDHIHISRNSLLASKLYKTVRSKKKGKSEDKEQ